MAIRFTPDRIAAFEALLAPLSAFKRAFGRDVTPGLMAELYAAKEFGLSLLDTSNAAGADATDEEGRKYQIKFRGSGTQNLDFNNFNFDFAVLVNMDEEYRLNGTWRLSVEQLRALCAHREQFRRFQITQGKFKAAAERAARATPSQPESTVLRPNDTDA